MLDRITVKNFGCFDDYDYKIDFKKLNVIVGTNNSGKSTIFKAMNLCRYIVNKYGTNSDLTAVHDPQLWNNRFYELINYQQSVYNHNKEKPIDIKIKFKNESVSINLKCYSEINFDLTGVLSEHNKIYIQKESFPTEKLKKCLYLSPNHDTIKPDNRLKQESEFQMIDPHGFDINYFLLKKFTEYDKNWDNFVGWMKKIDPLISLLKTPINDNIGTSLVSQRDDGKNKMDVNFTLQGDGIQYAITIISAILFSDEGSTIIIEEPESHLHNRGIEVLVDLFNYAVNELNKQIIIITHSLDLLSLYCLDIDKETTRANEHKITKPEDFKLIMFRDTLGESKIQEYNLENKKFLDVMFDFKRFWG